MQEALVALISLYYYRGNLELLKALVLYGLYIGAIC